MTKKQAKQTARRLTFLTGKEATYDEQRLSATRTMYAFTVDGQWISESAANKFLGWLENAYAKGKESKVDEALLLQALEDRDGLRDEVERLEDELGERESP